MMEALTPTETSSKGFPAPLNISSDRSTLVTMCKAQAGPGLFSACIDTGASSSVPLVFGSGGDISVLTGKEPKLGMVEACADMYTTTTMDTTTSVPVVLGTEGIGIDVLADVTEKSDLTTASLSASLINEAAVLVETPRGLVLSVGDEMRAVAYSNLADNAEDVQSTQLLSLGNTYIPVALLSQQNGLMEDQGGEVVFEGSGVAEVEGDGIVEQDGPIVCTTELPIVDQQGLTVPASDEEPKKKNRGWPKGKRRKATPEVCGPRAPMTGYVLYAIDRRQQIKQSHPHIHFTEVTKILGQEWSNMSPDKKQKYLEEAEKDKQRYIEELQAFQKSDVYQALMKKKRMKDGDQSDEAGAAFTDLEDETDELQCRACNVYFSSLHNKKEHLLGRQHLQVITDKLEKELKRQEKHGAAVKESHAASEDIVTPDDSPSLSDHGGNSEPCKASSPVDVNSFIMEFVQKNYERDQEILALRQSLRKDLQENWSICKQIQELRECESRLRQDLKNLAAHTATLSAQINNLKMVPSLFGISDF